MSEKLHGYALPLLVEGREIYAEDGQAVVLVPARYLSGSTGYGEAKRIAKLFAASPELAKALRSCADSLEAEIDARYGATKDHPALVGKYKQDMQDVVDARAALEKAGWK